jgi:hypothetical protein
MALDPVTVGDEGLILGLVVDEHDIGVATARDLERLPVLTATQRPSMPVLSSSWGMMWPNRPEASVEVVEVTVIASSPATAVAGASTLRHAEIAQLNDSG